MRVVVATGIFPPDIGGPATHAADLATELRRRGHQVDVVSLTDARRVERGAGALRFPRWWPWPLRMMAIAAWLVRRRQHFDAVYATGLDLAAVVGGRLSCRPVVLKVVGDTAWERGRRLGLTTASFLEFQGAPGGARLQAMRAGRDWAARHATFVVTPSVFLKGVVERWTQGHQAVAVIPNGVRAGAGAAGDVERRSARAPEDGLRVLYVGRLVAHKRVDVLLEAVARTRRVTLDVIGDGPETASLERAASRLGISARVAFLGALGREEVMRRLAGCDALVSASSYEGLPHVIIEALACGTPVVTSPAGGVVEVVHHGYNGLLVDPPEPAVFAATLDRLGTDEKLRSALAHGALDSGAAWRFERCADVLEDLLARLSRGRPRAIYLGRGGISWPPGDGLRAKLGLHARYFRQLSIGSGPAGVRRVSGVRVVLLPRFRPRVLSSLAFYLAGPLLAVVMAAAQKGSVIVCQGPFEALGVLVLRPLFPPSRRARLQIELHGDWRTASRLYGSRHRRLAAPLCDRVAAWTVRRADRIRVVSLALETLARDAGYAGPVDRHITFSEFDVFLAAPVAPPSRPRAVFVGALERSKAVDVLLDAWPRVVAQVPGAELLVVGDGTAAKGLRRRVADDGMTSVRFQEPVPQEVLAGLLDAATCLVLPSRSEGLPRIVLEAMARARPVVASEVGAMAELVDTTTGRLVPAEDVLALTDALVDVLSDLPRAARMGAAARARAETRKPAAEYEQGIARLAAWAVSGARTPPPSSWSGR